MVWTELLYHLIWFQIEMDWFQKVCGRCVNKCAVVLVVLLLVVWVSCWFVIGQSDPTRMMSNSQSRCSLRYEHQRYLGSSRAWKGLNWKTSLRAFRFVSTPCPHRISTYLVVWFCQPWFPWGHMWCWGSACLHCTKRTFGRKIPQPGPWLVYALARCSVTCPRTVALAVWQR